MSPVVSPINLASPSYITGTSPSSTNMPVAPSRTMYLTPTLFLRMPVLNATPSSTIGRRTRRAPETVSSLPKKMNALSRLTMSGMSSSEKVGLTPMSEGPGAVAAFATRWTEEGPAAMNGLITRGAQLRCASAVERLLLLDRYEPGYRRKPSHGVEPSRREYGQLLRGLAPLEELGHGLQVVPDDKLPYELVPALAEDVLVDQRGSLGADHEPDSPFPPPAGNLTEYRNPFAVLRHEPVRLLDYDQVGSPPLLDLPVDHGKDVRYLLPRLVSLRQVQDERREVGRLCPHLLQVETGPL